MMGIFDQYSTAYDAVLRYTRVHVELLNRCVMHLVGKKNILDVCCGTGLLEERLCGTGISVTGIDRNANMLGFARRKFTDDDEVQFYLQDASSLDFDDGSFDASVIINGIYCVDDPVKVLGEMARVTGKEGAVIVSGPLRKVDFSVVSKKMKEYFDINGMQDYGKRYMDIIDACNAELLGKGNCHLFDKEEMCAMLADSGCSSIIESRDDIYYNNSYLVVAKK